MYQNKLSRSSSQHWVCNMWACSFINLIQILVLCSKRKILWHLGTSCNCTVVVCEEISQLVLAMVCCFLPKQFKMLSSFIAVRKFEISKLNLSNQHTLTIIEVHLWPLMNAIVLSMSSISKPGIRLICWQCTALAHLHVESWDPKCLVSYLVLCFGLETYLNLSNTWNVSGTESCCRSWEHKKNQAYYKEQGTRVWRR